MILGRFLDGMRESFGMRVRMFEKWMFERKGNMRLVVAGVFLLLVGIGVAVAVLFGGR